MLTTKQASREISAAMPGFGTETVSLENAAGRVLRQIVTAERDQPPFDRVTMDGIAIQFAALQDDNRQFRIQATRYAGQPVVTLKASDACVEIMTGAVLPSASDCVIPVERIAVRDQVATVDADYRPEKRQFIHARGSDYRSGHEVLLPGGEISPAQIAIIASCGLDDVLVSELPTVSVVSTGDELVPAGNAIEDHQIRMSNGPAIVAMLAQHGYRDSRHHHIIDDRQALAKELAAMLETSSILVLSGGVSMGKADYVPQVLDDLGVRVIFHKVSQRPGKPLWFGVGPQGQAVFALPGNPVSALVCCRQYVLPALARASNRTPPAALFAVLAEDFTFKPDLTCFLPARTTFSPAGQMTAIPVATNTSGDFSALGSTDGYVELSRTENFFPAGTALRFHPWLLD